jgi:hypothetical protein
VKRNYVVGNITGRCTTIPLMGATYFCMVNKMLEDYRWKIYEKPTGFILAELDGSEHAPK